MIRSRTVRLAAIAVLGSAVLAGTTGCGGSREAGAAVLVNGNRITDRQIQDQVKELQTFEAAHSADIGKISQVAQASGFPALGDPSRDQVRDVIDDALWTKAAALDGLTVTAADDQAAATKLMNSITTNLQQVQIQLPSGLTVNDVFAIWVQSLGSGIVPSRIPALVHSLATQDVVTTAEAAKLKVDASTQNQPGPLNTALTQLLAKAQSQIGLKVSPRYASSIDLNARSLNLELASSTPDWVKAPAAAPKAPAAQAPQGDPQQQ